MTSVSSIIKTYPEVEKGLAKASLAPFEVSPSEPFRGEFEYLQSCNGLFDIRYNYNETCSSVRSSINNPRNNDKSETLSNVTSLVTLAQGYNELYIFALNLINQRLEANKSSNVLEPRIVRLAKKVNLTEKETLAMAYVVLTNAQMLTCRYGRGFDFADMALDCDMNLLEAMAFFSPSRVHVKEAVISPNEEEPHSYGFKVPYTSCAVLSGLELSEEILLKIDKTLLAEVLVQENNDAYSMLSAGTPEERKEKLKKSTSFDFDDIFGKKGDDDDAKSDADKETKDDFKFDDDDNKEEEEPKDIFEMVRDEIQKEKDKASDEDEPKTEDGDKKLQPYTTNTAYLSDHIEWLHVLLRVKFMVQELSSELTKDIEKEAQIRELKAKERMLKAKCEKRLAATLDSKWTPRLEKLVAHLQLSSFEKMVLLVLTANVLSPKISPDDSRYNSRVSNFSVGNLMGLFTDGFEQEIEFRKFFYKNATLVREGIIRLEDSYRNTELMNMEVELDRRMLDFIVGLDTEFSELVEGSHLYTSTVKLERVVLPEKQKADIVQAVKNFEQFQKSKKKLGLDEFLSYGSGMVLLFHGKSGTGKTMMANAIANMLGKRILLINYPSLGSRDSEILIKYIFREAKLTDSIIFFDECESIFQSRDRSDSAVNLLLTELEMHSQLVIMATNRAFDLDEAMHRRINHAVEFQVPNPRLRYSIWKAHIPESVALDKDVDLETLAIRFELSGGFIKNSVISAISSAVARNPNAPVISFADLTVGAEHQLRARLKMSEFDGRVVPDHGLEDLVASNEVKLKLRKIIRVEKARQVLYSEWGYSDKGANVQGTSVLFYGPPGSGKTHAAEAIGFETGKALKIENANSTYHKSDFEEALKNDAILVYDNASSLFKKPSTEENKKDNESEQLDLLYHMEKFPGITIVISNSLENVNPIFLKGFKFVVEFQLPTAENREVLWKKLLPPYAPIASDVDFKVLGAKYNFSGGNIKNSCFQAAASAALRMKEEEGEKNKITMKDLLDAAEDEVGNPLPEAVVYV